MQRPSLWTGAETGQEEEVVAHRILLSDFCCMKSISVSNLTQILSKSLFTWFSMN